MFSTVRATLLAALSTVSATPAGAADVTSAQADALQSQMRSWLQDTLGPDISPAAQVRPEGDHYRIELPLGTPRAGQPSPVTLSASARPADDGRWTFEGPELPSPARFTLNLPAPPGNGTAPGFPNPVEYTITAGSQDSRGTYDPSFAMPSTFTSNGRDIQVRAQSASIDQITKIGQSSSTSTLRPSGTDRADFMGENTTEGYVSVSRSRDGQPIELSAQHAQGTIEISALSRDRAATMLPAVVRVASSLLVGVPSSGAAPAASSMVDPRLLRIILQSLHGLASEFTMSQTFDGVALRSGTHGGAASQIRIGMEAKSDGGLLQATMDLGLDGLVLSNPALGAMVELLPTKVALRPVLTGVSTDAVLRWLDAMGDARDGTRPPGAATLFRRVGASAGLESFAIDVGGANFTGSGKLTTISGGDLAGQAQITASNFDDLIARVNAVPGLAGALPAFIFAKGISQTVEGRLVWNLAYRDNKLLVNGTDLSAMTGRPPVRSNPGPNDR